MICPQCNGEYREGFTSCSTCEVALVDKPHTAVDDEPPIKAIPFLVELVIAVALILGFFLLKVIPDTPNSWRWIYIGLAGLTIVLPRVIHYLKKSIQ